MYWSNVQKNINPCSYIDKGWSWSHLIIYTTANPKIDGVIFWGGMVSVAYRSGVDDGCAVVT